MDKIKIFFFSWDSFYGKLIKYHTGSKWTHVGIVASENADGYVCYEALNKGLTKVVYSKERVKQLEELGLLTVREAEVGNARRLPRICGKYEGAPYDWVSIFNIGWFALFGKVALNFKGPKAVICSEFVARVLYDISTSKIDLSKEYDKDFDLITPAEIFQSDKIN